MLSLRRFKWSKTTLFTALAVLSIYAVTGYTDHVKDESGELWDDKVLWQIATGDHEWNNTDTYSYHYMYVENNLNTWVDLTYKWRHELKQGNAVLKSDQSGNLSSPLRIASGDIYSTSGWLNTGTAGGILPGNYKIKSTTKIKMENGHNRIQDWLSVSKTTDFVVEE